MARKKTDPVLSQKQEAFAQHYAVHGNATEAYRVAFKPKRATPKSINELASKTLAAVKVKSRIDELVTAKKAVMTEKFEVTLERIVQELAGMAFYDPRSFQSWGTRTVTKKRGKGENVTEYEEDEPFVEFTPSANLTDFQAKAVQGVEMSVTRTGDKVMSLKLADRRAALVELAKLHGFYEKDNAQRSANFFIVEDDSV